ncbi:hypothetical protein EAI_05907 [Harpegnathos saltator]|uniref:Uncharacterized protein n=1 Tax=Harpegnathos saltator TaxID=610380 RepID=E2C496_HARSA|nr:hypothetical protein EAI_05907 [Harpegnathos saltator]
MDATISRTDQTPERLPQSALGHTKMRGSLSRSVLSPGRPNLSCEQRNRLARHVALGPEHRLLHNV